MNWENILPIIASSIGVSIVMYYMKKGNAKEIKINKNGVYILRLPKMYKYIGIMSIVIIFIFLIPAFIYQDKLWIVMLILVIVIFGGAGVPCLLGFQNYKLEFNEQRIIVSNWRRIKTELKWTEIQAIKFNPISGYIKLKGNGKTLKINHHLEGYNVFKQKINQKTKWNSKELKLP